MLGPSERDIRHYASPRSNGQWRCTNRAYGLAMLGGSSGGSRRVTTKTPASTRGIGRNSPAGMRCWRRNSHQGAHTVERRVEGGAAARFCATSHCTTRSGRTRGTHGSSRRRRKMSVVRPKGREPITRNGCDGSGKDRKSPSTTRTRPSAIRRTRSRSCPAHTGSASGGKANSKRRRRECLFRVVCCRSPPN